MTRVDENRRGFFLDPVADGGSRFAKLGITPGCFLIFEKRFQGAVIHPKFFQGLTVPLDPGTRSADCFSQLLPFFWERQKKKLVPCALSSDRTGLAGGSFCGFR